MRYRGPVHRVPYAYYAQDGGGFKGERRLPPGLERVRNHPVRSGLIGLAIAGMATPLVYESTQRTGGDRTNPSHERLISFAPPAEASERAVAEAWRERIRDRTILNAVERFSQYNLTPEMAGAIYDAAVEAEVDPDIAFGLVRAESGFRNHATSVVGAIGITQLMPRTARWMEPGISNQALRDPQTNAKVGFKYLRYLLDKYDEDENLALLAYNRGPGTVDGILRRGGNPDNGYAAFVRGEEGHGHTLFSR